MRNLLLLLLSVIVLTPADLSANILKDYVGKWKYIESWKGSKAGDDFKGTYTITTTKSRDGSYQTRGLVKVGSKQVLAYEEVLKANKSALLRTFDPENGKLTGRYTGKWFIRSGRLHYDYKSGPSSSGRVDKLKGSLMRTNANRWSGSATFTGGYKITIQMTRL